jgi:hypothetical protein
MRRIRRDFCEVRLLRWQTEGVWQFGTRSARRRKLSSMRVEVPAVQSGQHDPNARPAVVKVLTLLGRYSDLQHSQGLAFKEELVVYRRGDHRIQREQPFRTQAWSSLKDAHA